MIRYIIIAYTVLVSMEVFSQDCIDYHVYSCIYDKHPHYSIDPPGSKSMLMKPGEQMELAFYIYQGRDYRITTCSNLYKDRIILKIYDAEDPSLLLYDNEQNDMAQSFEFQVMSSRRVRAYVTIKEKDVTKKTVGLLVEKVPRDCVGLLLETMVTRK